MREHPSGAEVWWRLPYTSVWPHHSSLLEGPFWPILEPPVHASGMEWDAGL